MITVKGSNRALVRLLLLLVVILFAGRISASSMEQNIISETSQSAIDTGDTCWILVSAALVLLMTPGLAFFYGGLVRRKNMLSVLMQCLMIMCIISLQWVLVGYSLSFGPDKGSIIGGLEWLGLRGVGLAPNPEYASTIPHQLFMMFQMMFAIITPALIIGAFAERMKFSSFCVFSLLWATFIYDPICHWIWGAGGFLKEAGALDFAGGAVVHISAGMTALAAAFILGRRQGFPDKVSPPHNLPFAALGAGLLWFGWFGFNAGSALSAGAVASSAFTATHIAGATAGTVWCVLDWLKFKKPTTLGMITGAIAGLAAVTPASGFVTPAGAIWIGIGAGIFPWLVVTYLKTKFNYDDTLDAFSVHGVGGIWGTIAAGIWATTEVNPDGANGLLHGNPIQLWIQIKMVLLVAVFSFVGGGILLKFIDLVMKLRVTEHEERVGLDLTQHREGAYTLIS